MQAVERQTLRRRSQQEEGKDRKEMQKESRTARCTLLNGATWNTEKKFMSRYKGTFDIFFGIEHKMRKEEMEEQFNDRSQIRTEDLQPTQQESSMKMPSSEDRKHTSGGVFCYSGQLLWEQLLAKKKKEQLSQFEATREELPKAWSTCARRCACFLSITSGTRKVWTPRNEALMEEVIKQARTIRHPWLIACDANMCPEDVEKSLWF